MPSAPHTSTDTRLIQLKGLTKIYTNGENQVHALRPTDLDFHTGQFVAIVGPSGSGKSSLLNLLGLLDQPTAGEYWLQENNVANLNDRQISDIRCHKIGFIFQSFNLFGNMSVMENICVPMVYAERSRVFMQERVEVLAERLGLEDRLDHRPNQLSGGQCQRVAIARALANDPPVLLADEPTGNLDEKTGNEVMEIFREIRSEGRSILMVTHNPEYENEVDRVIEIKDGRIIRQ